MPLTTHALIDEFPEFRGRIRELQTSNPQFAQLFTEYHALDDEILRIEQQVETPCDAYIEERKMKRVYLKDRLYGMLRA